MEVKMRSGTNFLLLMLCAVLVLSGSESSAMTNKKLTLQQKVALSEIVFDGKPVGREVKLEGKNKNPYTYVTFKVFGLLKGKIEGEKIILRFSGGEKNGLKSAIGGGAIPGLGERGIYFVESSRGDLAYPLTGGQEQGVYKIDKACKKHSECTQKQKKQCPLAKQDQAQDRSANR